MNGQTDWPGDTTHGAALVVLSLASACTTTPPTPTAKLPDTISANFACDDSKTIHATFLNAPAGNSVRLTLSDGRMLPLPQTLSGSGARYAMPDDRVVFWNKGDTAFIEEGGRMTYTGCVVRR